MAMVAGFGATSMHESIAATASSVSAHRAFASGANNSATAGIVSAPPSPSMLAVDSQSSASSKVSDPTGSFMSPVPHMLLAVPSSCDAEKQATGAAVLTLLKLWARPNGESAATCLLPLRGAPRFFLPVVSEGIASSSVTATPLMVSYAIGRKSAVPSFCRMVTQPSSGPMPLILRYFSRSPINFNSSTTASLARRSLSGSLPRARPTRTMSPPLSAPPTTFHLGRTPLTDLQQLSAAVHQDVLPSWQISSPTVFHALTPPRSRKRRFFGKW
mmetsp:Transcript_77317/g.153406  ORF Transcript_77317/g.153406 Transcript_77317/m.153406 type:complete len:272 (-) Transcript_77317:150-965(-)